MEQCNESEQTLKMEMETKVEEFNSDSHINELLLMGIDSLENIYKKEIYFVSLYKHASLVHQYMMYKLFILKTLLYYFKHNRQTQKRSIRFCTPVFINENVLKHNILRDPFIEPDVLIEITFTETGNSFEIKWTNDYNVLLAIVEAGYVRESHNFEIH